MQTRNEELYLDDMNRAVEIQKIQFSYQNLLNDAANQNGLIQRQISEQMNDQLAYLQEKTKLSQVDIDYANAQLAILEKQIALQDVQQNKTQMQLQRDATGNYSYVYTADEDELANKQQELLDAQINAYNIAKEGLLQAEEDTISQISDARDEIVSIWTDASLDIEERQARIQEVMDSLSEYTNTRSDQIKTYSLEVLQQVAISEGKINEENAGNLEDIYNTMDISLQEALENIDDRFLTFADATGQKVAQVEGELEQLKTSMVVLAEQARESSIDTLDAFDDYKDNLIGKVQMALEAFEEKTKESLEQIGIPVENTDENTNVLVSSIQDCGTEIDRLNQNQLPALQENLEAVSSKIMDIITNLHGENGEGGLIGAVKNAQEHFEGLYTSISN